MSLQRLTCNNVSDETLIHVCNPCERELGRVRGVVLFDGSFDTESLIAKLLEGTEEAAQEAAKIFEDAIENGDAHLISETTGTFDGGSPQTGDGYGDEETRLLGYLYTLSFKDPSYAGNKDFYERAENSHWKIGFRTETLFHIGDKVASIQAIAPVEQDLTSAVAWNVTATWKSKAKPDIVPLAPIAKYFEGCWEKLSV
ncbi:MAG: hypothetical protein NC229_08465 [Bacteroides sp.]|nr:hypothetical protein [Bacteroidales bacterium]MCM1068723.1 hypothetical protein [Prevotella sp.]MCM1354677.1 hypothetical protein [Bacteroides sp.]MCM1403775.1 hypothetical protein [Bacteroides sp.]MCM1443507.1 hypothetical protein [Muribaculum sp.]